MIYICDKCGKEYTDTPEIFSYGFKKGKPFLVKVCKECSKAMTDKEVEDLIFQKNSVTTSEELGILGQ